MHTIAGMIELYEQPIQHSFTNHRRCAPLKEVSQNYANYVEMLLKASHIF